MLKWQSVAFKSMLILRVCILRNLDDNHGWICIYLGEMSMFDDMFYYLVGEPRKAMSQRACCSHLLRMQ